MAKKKVKKAVKVKPVKKVEPPIKKEESKPRYKCLNCHSIYRDVSAICVYCSSGNTERIG